MEHLVHSFPSNLQVAFRRLLGLLDEGMQYHDPLTDGEAVKRPSDALSSTGPQLEKSAAHSSRVWHPHIRPKIHQQFHESRIVGQNVIGQSSISALTRALKYSFDRISHEAWLANLITKVNREG